LRPPARAVFCCRTPSSSTQPAGLRTDGTERPAKAEPLSAERSAPRIGEVSAAKAEPLNVQHGVLYIGEVSAHEGREVNRPGDGKNRAAIAIRRHT
jgi:hypothetical protein